MIYTFTARKGGTGKTTTAATLAQAAAHRGRRALAVDLDPQANLSYLLAADARQAGAYELLHGTPAAELIQHSPQGLDVIAGSMELETETTFTGSARRLAAALKPLEDDYSIIVIDTPAYSGELQYNAIQAAQGLIIPLSANSLCLQSLYQTAATLPAFRKSNPALTVTGCILTKYDKRTNVAKHFSATIQEKAEALNIPFLGTVRQAAAVETAAGFQESIFDFAPRSKPAADYLAIYDKLTI